MLGLSKILSASRLSTECTVPHTSQLGNKYQEILVLVYFQKHCDVTKVDCTHCSGCLPSISSRVVVEAGTSETKTETWVAEIKTETEAI